MLFWYFEVTSWCIFCVMVILRVVLMWCCVHTDVCCFSVFPTSVNHLSNAERGTLSHNKKLPASGSTLLGEWGAELHACRPFRPRRPPTPPAIYTLNTQLTGTIRSSSKGRPLKRKCYLDEFFIIRCTGNFQNNNFLSSQWCKNFKMTIFTFQLSNMPHCWQSVWISHRLGGFSTQEISNVCR